MEAFPAPARAMVEEMQGKAAADPSRAIAFQGSPGANSHKAACDYDQDGLPLPCHSFSEALVAVKDGRAGRAAIPIENSAHGRVADIHFLLPESGLYIVGEFFMPIAHALMGVPRADGSLGPFSTAFSHPQALGQSRRFLRERGILPMAHADTAGAAAFVAERGDPEDAAIAPAIAAELYGLSIAEHNVEDEADNMTRFVICAPKPLDPEMLTGRDVITTMVFQVKNVPAALYKALGGFATNGVNMTKLESYQDGASFAATKFFVDCVGGPGDPAVDRALEELAFHSASLRLLGTYPQARKRN